MHQYLFYIGDFPVRAYGLLLSLGIFCAAAVGYFLLKKDGRGWHVHMVDFAIYTGIAGIIGARLWDVFFFDWHYYQHHLLEIPFVWQGGMAIQGGVILGTLVGIWYVKRQGIDPWAFADIFVPALILGQSVGRMANLMNGDAFGHPTGGNFGILYPETTLAFKTYGAQPLWPAEIWEGQIDILIFVILLLFNTTKHKKGQTFVLYAVLYSAARFFLEFLRGDYVNLTMGLKSAQMTSLAVIIVGIIVFIILQIKGKYDEHVLLAHEAADQAATSSNKGKQTTNNHKNNASATNNHKNDTTTAKKHTKRK
ncbi:prolipoprotein diacylglyceryl transferase [Veillonella intestinalis]|uniref:prolipoprotein diacylglyceryl transferase n=1 Tax=Veillonella intestinalis TaxID=2941341 RepID=UPI00204053E8|nr:prolipoprotein diacylglyceryl transferase [Veillonella intestinalis]